MIIKNDITYDLYDKSKTSIEEIKNIIKDELSEPYSIFTYKHFFYNFQNLSFLAFKEEKIVGVITGYSETKKNRKRGYIAMLVVNPNCRGKQIGLNLVNIYLKKMKELEVEEVILDVDATNKVALNLYDSLGFMREKNFLNYYQSGNDAYRMKLYFKENNN